MTSTQQKTKDKIVKTSIDLMLTHGYNATSIDEICEAAKVTKGAIFYYFKSKEDLAEQILYIFFQNMMQISTDYKSKDAKDPLKRHFGYLDSLIKISKNPKLPASCLVGNFAQEVAMTNKRLRKACDTCFDDWIDYVEKDLILTKKKYAPKEKIDTRSLAEMLVSIIQGSVLIRKSGRENASFKRNIRHYKKYIQLIFRTNG